MPLYEYTCQSCKNDFDALRSIAQADAPIACPACGSEDTQRIISLFSAIGSEGVIASGGNSCSTCAATSCSSCSSKTQS